LNEMPHFVTTEVANEDRGFTTVNEFIIVEFTTVSRQQRATSSTFSRQKRACISPTWWKVSNHKSREFL